MFNFLLMSNQGLPVIATATDQGTASGVRTLDVSGMSLQENDFLLVVFAFSEADETFAMTGFTEVCDLRANSTRDVNLHIGYKIQTSSPDTTVTLNSASMSTSQPWVALAYNVRGVDTATPLDVAATTATANNTGIADPPAITPANAGGLVIASAAAGSSLSGTFTSPDLQNFTALNQNPAAGSEAVTFGSGLDRSAGASNPSAFTFPSDSTQNGYCACTIALRAA